MTQFPSTRLVVIGGGDVGEQFRLTHATLYLGRSATNDICLSWDPRVSRNHARLLWQNDAWFIEDMGSTNGTFIETERVEGLVSLAHGARLRAGRVWLQVVLDHLVATVPEPVMAEPTTAALPPPLPPPPPLLAEPTEPERYEPVPEPALVDAAEPEDFFEPAAAPESALEPEPVVAVEDSSWFVDLPEDLLVTAEPARVLGASTEEAPVAVAEPVLAVAVEEPLRAAHEPALSVKVAPLLMEIRAVATDPGQASDTDVLQTMLRELDLPAHLQAQMRETLGSADVLISLTAPPGAQGELLVFAGQVVARLSEMPEYSDILVTPHNDGA